MERHIRISLLNTLNTKKPFQVCVRNGRHFHIHSTHTEKTEEQQVKEWMRDNNVILIQFNETDHVIIIIMWAHTLLYIPVSTGTHSYTYSRTRGGTNVSTDYFLWWITDKNFVCLFVLWWHCG